MFEHWNHLDVMSFYKCCWLENESQIHRKLGVYYCCEFESILLNRLIHLDLAANSDCRQTVYTVPYTAIFIPELLLMRFGEEPQPLK